MRCLDDVRVASSGDPEFSYGDWDPGRCVSRLASGTHWASRPKMVRAVTYLASTSLKKVGLHCTVGGVESAYAEVILHTLESRCVRMDVMRPLAGPASVARILLMAVSRSSLGLRCMEEWGITMAVPWPGPTLVDGANLASSNMPYVESAVLMYLSLSPTLILCSWKRKANTGERWCSALQSAMHWLNFSSVPIPARFLDMYLCAKGRPSIQMLCLPRAVAAR